MEGITNKQPGEEQIPAPEINEDFQSKLPALQLLVNLGYHYLTRKEAVELRNNRYNQVILDGILVPWLRKHNTIRFKNETHRFSESNIINAVQSLKDVVFDGLIRTNEKVFELLCSGKSMQQSIDGDLKSFTLNYIDWENPGNNVFHVTEEFIVERSGSRKVSKPDIVLFVNGIPLVVIENKSPALKDPMHDAISQHLRYQKEDDIPKLYIYSQLLLALATNEALYATTGTPGKFWALWREEGSEQKVTELCNIPLDIEIVEKIFSMRNFTPHNGLVKNKQEERLITTQDRLVYALCRPERLLELIYNFILYDAGAKKIARYQQYFCVRTIMDRIRTRDAADRRRGGVVWHTQGSGKSLTMVFLAKAIALCDDIKDHRVILVTDRIDLDDQIYKTFRNCGSELKKAKTGKDLSKLLKEQKRKIITTVIDKFDAAVGRHAVRIENGDIFVLIDESHRGQYGPRHANMRRVLPNACFIGFTGTPVMKKDKNTVDKFGGLIQPSYTMQRAVEDKAVVPLLYEGRHVGQKVDSEPIDAWFERITQSLSREQVEDLKRKFSTTDQINKTEQKVMRIAWDISEHFRDTWKGTPFKAQLVTQDKATALLYKQYLDEFDMVSSEVLISGPEEAEGEEQPGRNDKQDVQKFWKTMMQRFGSEKEYNKQIIAAFKKTNRPEIIIVVDKLLTGFDAPRNTVLYLTRKLKDHTLLQAVARVNRLHEKKEFGYIVDYRGILENLDQAFDLYNALAEFDAKDLEYTIADIGEQIATLPQKPALLRDTFKEVKNRNDQEEYERLLADEALRTRFYERLSAFSRTLAIAMSTVRFAEETPPEQIDRFRDDLKFFSKLRASVRRRYAEVVEFSEYEPKIRKLLDTHVGSGEIEQVTPLVDIFDKEAFAEEVAKLRDPAAKADTIAHRTKRTIYERMRDDPAFYKRFSQMIEDAIRAFREERIKAAEYLSWITNIRDAVTDLTDYEIPGKLKEKDIARAFFGVIKENFPPVNDDPGKTDDSFANVAIEVENIIERNRIVNWVNNIDIQNTMRTEIEDLIFDLKEQTGVDIDFDTIDEIMEQCIDIAVRRPTRVGGR